MYADIFANYSPDGAVNFKYTDVVAAMQQGNTAIIMEGAPLGGKINDPEKSTGEQFETFSGISIFPIFSPDGENICIESQELV